MSYQHIAKRKNEAKRLLAILIASNVLLLLDWPSGDVLFIAFVFIEYAWQNILMYKQPIKIHGVKTHVTDNDSVKGIMSLSKIQLNVFTSYTCPPAPFDENSVI